jgi:hypothetical protein
MVTLAICAHRSSIILHGKRADFLVIAMHGRWAASVAERLGGGAGLQRHVKPCEQMGLPAGRVYRNTSFRNEH